MLIGYVLKHAKTTETGLSGDDFSKGFNTSYLSFILLVER